MGQRYTTMPDRVQQFIKAQHLFFAGTAADDRVNISPKGMDSLRVLGKDRVVWLNVTGSGNETSAHIQENPRMTLMFVAFDGPPMIVRLYGTARVVHKNDADWDALIALFAPLSAARQIFDMTIDLVQTSCGMTIPIFDYAGERDHWTKWVAKQGDEDIRAFWRTHNQVSLDGQSTHILEKNT